MTSSQPSDLLVDQQRIARRLEALARIGATPDGGVTRLAFGAEELEARRLFADWLEEAGLEIRWDAAGNLFGRLGGQGPTIMAGSHLDTVPDGGRYDGALGCVTALEAATVLAERGFAPFRPVEVAVWSDEEGCRFGTGFFGSRFFTGVLPESAPQQADASGVTVAEALAAWEIAANPAVQPPPVAYLELHIEQGPVLERLDLPVGIVTGIVGIHGLRLRFEGQAGHAGTTPMDSRRDALAAAAEIVLACESIARERAGTVATVGELHVRPGASNVVPGECAFSVDVRHLDEGAWEEAAADVGSAIDRVAARRALRASVQETLHVPPVPLSPRLQDIFASACERRGLPVYRLPSGAGHDAMILAGVTDAAMLFVRSRGGISHNPAEYTTVEDAAAGAQVLLDAVADSAFRSG